MWNPKSVLKGVVTKFSAEDVIEQLKVNEEIQ